jgi:hypothetical protein
MAVVFAPAASREAAVNLFLRWGVEKSLRQTLLRMNGACAPVFCGSFRPPRQSHQELNDEKTVPNENRRGGRACIARSWLRDCRVSAELIFCFAILIAIPFAASAAEPLFPQPLHIVRVVDDPVAGRSMTVEEYYAGNRVVAVSGELVAIADYAAETLTRIDRAAGTFSIVRFADLAAARGELVPERRLAMSSGSSTPLSHGTATHLGRSVELHRADLGDDSGSVEIAVDRSFILSPKGLEVVSGSAWPSAPTPQGRAILSATAPSSELRGIASQSVRAHGLPVRVRTTFRMGSDSFTVENRVESIDSATVAAELIAIPPGASEVPHPDVEAARRLRELDMIAPTSERR